MIRSELERARSVMRQRGISRQPTLLERLEDLASDLYSYAADEYNLARVSGEPEDERYLNAYNLVTEAIVAMERDSK